MYDPHLEKLIEIALEDGVLTDKERSVLFKKAQSLGIDSDEFEMVLESRLKARLGSQQPEKKQEKFGNILKCPSCGSPVPAFITKCKECDYEFRNVNANSTIKSLAERLDSIDPNISFESLIDFKKTTIMNHAIPNTKEDILEFAMFVASNLNAEVNKGFKCCFPSKYGKEITDTGKIRKLNDVWIEKYYQIIGKSKVFAKEDTNLIKQIFEIIAQKDIRFNPILNGNIVLMFGFFVMFIDIVVCVPLALATGINFLQAITVWIFLFGFLSVLFCPVIPVVINGFISYLGLNKIIWDK